MVDDLVSGAIWCNISFNAISPILAKEKLEKWLPRYFQYFKVNINKEQLPSGKFFIYVKEIETSKDWEKDFLRRQMEKPWIKAGELTQERESNIFTWTEEMEKIFEEEKIPK